MNIDARQTIWRPSPVPRDGGQIGPTPLRGRRGLEDHGKPRTSRSGGRDSIILSSQTETYWNQPQTVFVGDFDIDCVRIQIEFKLNWNSAALVRASLRNALFRVSRRLRHETQCFVVFRVSRRLRHETQCFVVLFVVVVVVVFFG